MAKASGNTRNYRGNAKVMATRRSEFGSLMARGDYDVARSFFDPSGGFVATHVHHNYITNTTEDKSDIAVSVLASKGYKVYLDDERSMRLGESMPDGRVYTAVMDIKTINTAGSSTIKAAIEGAASQGATTAILYQNTKSMTRAYVESQIAQFKEKSPAYARNKINRVIVVGLSGRVHVHNI
ncbi:MAG: hypothetical protein J5733_00950 [Bacteroidaceae bacterium]|nr:hypothetical protein [Bacteroidaceae bacterium]